MLPVDATSVEDVVRHLSERKVPVELGPVARTGAEGGLVSVYVRDPDGNLVELAARGAADPDRSTM